MVYIQDFANVPDRNFVGHELIFRDFDSGEKIKEMKSASSLPVPRKGEEVHLAEYEVVIKDGTPAWGDSREIDPESDGLTYRVEAIEHEYGFIEPSEKAELGYETGQMVFTAVFVVKTQSELPV